MTFKEWTKEIRNEKEIKKLHLSEQQIRFIMLAGIRVLIEELICDPRNSELNILGFGSFYLVNRKYGNKQKCFNAIEGRWREPISFSTIELHFRASRQIRELLNGKRSLSEIKIGSKPLYISKEDLEDIAKTQRKRIADRRKRRQKECLPN